MDRRTHEGPMDWEYQGTGPVDVTSPFAHVARANPQTSSIFASPSKLGNRPNPFAPQPVPNPFAASSFTTPAKSQPHPPQTSFFSPRIQGNQAPPFRNPAFTTPRRPFDEHLHSEASGAETSPGLTETSDCPNDTPDVDHSGDHNMGNSSPTKMDKTYRIVKSAYQPRRHVAGRGEIPRPHKDFSAIDVMRKRKRHNYDRDVGSVRYHDHDSNVDSDDEEPDGHTDTASQRQEKQEPAGKRGLLWGVFRAMEDHPHAPESFQKWTQVILNLLLCSGLLWIAYATVNTVRSDLRVSQEAARMERLNKIEVCTSHYKANLCGGQHEAPAMKDRCQEWYACMLEDPYAVMRVRATIKEVAEIINEFAGTMHLKAWGFFFGILVVCFIANNLSMGRSSAPKPTNPIPSHPVPNFHGHADTSQAYMMVPVQTPQVRRQARIELEQASDTDESSWSKYNAIMPPQTPSRRSPSKGHRTLSPSKRSPSKVYR